VRSLEREISKYLPQGIARVVKEGKHIRSAFGREHQRVLGVLKYREIWNEKKNEIGLATGLAWTRSRRLGAFPEATIMAGQRAADADRQARRRHAGVAQAGR